MSVGQTRLHARPSPTVLLATGAGGIHFRHCRLQDHQDPGGRCDPTIPATTGASRLRNRSTAVPQHDITRGGLRVAYLASAYRPGRTDVQGGVQVRLVNRRHAGSAFTAAPAADSTWTPRTRVEGLQVRKVEAISSTSASPAITGSNW